MNAFAYIFTAWVPIFTFPTAQQPNIVLGNYINAGFGGGALILALLIGYLSERDYKLARPAVNLIELPVLSEDEKIPSGDDLVSLAK